MSEVIHQRTVARGMNEWQQAVNDYRLPVVLEWTLDDRAVTDIERATVGAVQLFVVSAPPHRLSRLQQEAAANREIYYTISLLLEGTSHFSHRGRTEVFGPGDFGIFDADMMRLNQTAEHTRTLIVTLPQSAFRLPPRALAAIAGTRMGADDPLGRHISALLTSLASSLAALGPGALNFVHSTIDLVVSSYAATSGVTAPHRSRERLELMDRIQQDILERLGDPELSPASIAAASFVSTRKLHVLFREHGTTVSTWIRERRLEMARRDLGDERLADEPIRDIAARWGFTDAAHFSTVFRRTYGVTPRGYRQHG